MTSLTKDLLPGRWYCIGWMRDDGTMQWEDLIRYVGDGQFENEEGEPVEYLWCPDLQARVSVHAADAYQLQG